MGSFQENWVHDPDDDWVHNPKANDSPTRLDRAKNILSRLRDELNYANEYGEDVEQSHIIEEVEKIIGLLQMSS